MSESSTFSVNTEGVAEPLPTSGPQQEWSPIHDGVAVVVTSENNAMLNPLHSDAKDAQYYVDPSGRVIDTRTGELVEQRESVGANLKLLRDREQMTK